ncbi:MAG: hypothetical protein V4696_03830 [Pseudomonadota bacterium]
MNKNGIIHRFRLSITEPVELELTRQCQVLHVAMQQGVPHIWIARWADLHGALVRDFHGNKRVFEIFATGALVPNCFGHRGTIVDEQRGLVWHVFEKDFS